MSIIPKSAGCEQITNIYVFCGEVFQLSPANIFGGLVVRISACHLAMRGRPGFDSPPERIFIFGRSNRVYVRKNLHKQNENSQIVETAPFLDERDQLCGVVVDLRRYQS